MDQALRQAVEEAARRADVRGAVEAIYAELSEEIDQRRPRCDASGRCCRFEEFGHRLYVTTVELATFLFHHRHRPPEGSENQSGGHSLRVLGQSGGAETWDGTGCPFQVGKLCGVHAIRPFGCRMFFCDADTTMWQNETYERFHTRLKAIHHAAGIPYFYVEWRRGLGALGLSGGSLSAGAV